MDSVIASSTAMLPDAERAQAARAFFPRGLEQPVGRFRFSVDALLLAAFCAPPQSGALADLGAGCGVAGLGLLLRYPERVGLTLLALDKDPAMVAAAGANAARLGLESRAQALELDLKTLARDKTLPAESLDLVLANPPYRKPGQGRPSANPARGRALFELDAEFADFAGAAAYLLKAKGGFFVIHLAERLLDACEALRAAGLEPKRLLPVQGREDAPAKLLLIEARKAGRPGLRLDPALTLYVGRGRDTRLSARALAFCPFLACNAERFDQTRDSASEQESDAQTTAA
jgi:tRNA1(Val) A37 N6-methylase TrmN6